MTSRAETWGVPLLLAFLIFLFFLGILVTNRYVIPWDAMSYYYPMTFFLVENLKQFSVPLWNPHIFAGLPSVADPQVSTFYPSKWLLALLSAGSPLSYKLYEGELLFHYFLAGLFMFRFLRSLGLLQFSALTGAFTFMFSGALVARAQHHTIVLAMAWVPLLFMYVRLAIVNASVPSAVKAGLILGLQFLAGHPQTSVYTAVAIGFYCVWEGVVRSAERHQLSELWRSSATLILTGVVGAGVAAVQLLPTVELSRISIRAARPEIESDFIGPLNPIHLIKLVLPNFWGGLHRSDVWYRHDPTETTFYLGITALLLIAIALRFLDRKTLVWAIGAVFFLLLAMADFLYWPRLFYYLAPKLNLFARHGNYFLFTTFCLSVLAGFGMDFLWQSEKQPETLAFVQKLRLWGLMVASLGLMFSSLVALIPAAEAQARVFTIVDNQIIAAVFFFLALGLFLLVLTRKLGPPIVQTLMLVLMVIDVFTFNSHQSFTQARYHPGTFLSPKEVDGSSTWIDLLRGDVDGDFRKDYRIATFGLGEIWSNGGNVVGFQNLFGYDPIALQPYTSLLSQVVGKFERTPEFTVAPDVHAAILDAASMKYVLIHDELQETEKLVFRPEKYTMLGHRPGITAYLNKSFIPRAYIAPRALILPPGIPAADFMASPVFVPSAMALVEHSETQDVPKQLASPAPVIFLEAENFTDKSTQGRVVNFSHAWNQKVLAGWGNVPGDVVTYRLDLPASLASPVLFLRYAMETDRPAVLDVYVDGASKKVASLECPPTPGWGGIASDWKYVSLKLGRLAQGPHELRFVSAVGGPIHPDALVLAGDTGSRSTGTARITDSKPNFVEIETQVPSQGFLALSDVYYSGWKASVDGRPAKILRTNAVFRGLPLGPGNHTIQFRFEPRSVYAGAVVTLATLALCSFGLFRASRPKS
jgi:membrane protein YfhO